MIKNFKKCSGSPEHKKVYNQQLFQAVAPKYDLITKILSCNHDARWKQYLIERIPAGEYNLCLDIACGTGDLTFALARRFGQAHIHGIDLTPRMLEYAQKKNTFANVQFMMLDMCHLGHQSGTVDLISGGYALRNAPDLAAVLQECVRVLKPGGIAAFLDFSKPSSKLGQHATYYLLKFWGGLWGLLLHANPAVYGYIAESLARYPDRNILYTMLNGAGFDLLETKRFFGGIIELIICKKRGS